MTAPLDGPAKSDRLQFHRKIPDNRVHLFFGSQISPAHFCHLASSYLSFKTTQALAPFECLTCLFLELE